MNTTYEINGSVFNNKGMTDGDCYTLTNTAQREQGKTYNSLDEALEIKKCDLTDYTAITIYEWSNNEITNVFFIK